VQTCTAVARIAVLGFCDVENCAGCGPRQLHGERPIVAPNPRHQWPQGGDGFERDLMNL